MVPTFTWALVLSYLALAISDVSFAFSSQVLFFEQIALGAHPIFWAFRPVCRLAPDKEKPSAQERFRLLRDENARAKGFEHAGSILGGLIDETDKGDANGKI